MKRLNPILQLALVIMILSSSCKKSMLTTYNTSDNIYFNYFRDVDPDRNQAGFPSDNVSFTFAYSTPNVTSAVIPIPIAVTGTPRDIDRQFQLTVDPKSTTNAQHFTLPANFVMRAGRVVDTIFLKLNRTADLQTREVTAIFNLTANSEFSTDLKRKIKDNGADPADTINLLSFKVLVSDILAPGPSWGIQYFGAFSIKKVRLMNEVAGMPLNFWSIANGITDFKEQSALASYYAAFMSRYLQDQALAGNIIYEQDGITRMRMGNAYQ